MSTSGATSFPNTQPVLPLLMSRVMVQHTKSIKRLSTSLTLPSGLSTNIQPSTCSLPRVLPLRTKRVPPSPSFKMLSNHKQALCHTLGAQIMEPSCRKCGTSAMSMGRNNSVLTRHWTPALRLRVRKMGRFGITNVPERLSVKCDTRKVPR